MKKTYMIVAPKDESSYEVYVEVGDGFCGDFVCSCLTRQYANKICDALEEKPKVQEVLILEVRIGEE